MITTQHAQARMQQRGITPAVVELILGLGDQSYDRDGSTYYLLQDKKRRLALASDLRRIAGSLEAPNGLFAVESGTGELITVGRQHRRRQHRKAYAKP